MLTIKTLESIKRGARTTLFSGVYSILLGIFYIGFFEWIMRSNFRSINVVWQVFSKYNPEITSMLIKLMIIKGLFVIALGVVTVYLSAYILRRKDRATWIVLFVIGLIFWPSILTFEVLDKNWLNVSLVLIGWIIFIVGMLIPIRYYLEMDEEEY